MKYPRMRVFPISRAPYGLGSPRFAVFLIAWLGTLGNGHAAEGASISIPSDALATLRKGHPRLLASAEDFARLQERVKTDAQLRQWHEKLREQARRILAEPPSTYEIPDGLRLLSVSRRVLNRTYTLALLYRLDGDPSYLERTWRELDAAARFQDWNPRHFLDTAEMTHAFAIGYDWLHDAWTEEQRAVMRAAMVEKGIQPAVQIHEEARWWARARHNWNQVCNGGIGMGALALADLEPELASRFLRAALQSIQLAMVEYGPDGAWTEGPGYWNYATTYNVTFLAALQTALGTDFGLSNIPGFSDAGLFPVYTTGPLGRTFNYADGGDGTIRSASLFWLARQFHQPACATYQRQVASPHPLDLVWFDPSIDPVSLGSLALDKYFRHAEVVTLRGAWDDREAVFVGFKAGDNKANHSNLDLGTFVLDALGVRWAVDLGADNYNLPGYFGSQRWNYYRMRAEGHNTLVINPGSEPDQDPAATAKIIRFDATPARAIAVADLTPAYSMRAQNVTRGIALLERKRVLVQDEVRADAPADIWWFLHTSAQVKVGEDGLTAILSQNSSRLEARILSPADAAFTVMDAVPLPTSPHPENQNNNDRVRKLAIHLKDDKNLRVAVLLTPASDAKPSETSPPRIVPLADW